MVEEIHNDEQRCSPAGMSGADPHAELERIRELAGRLERALVQFVRISHEPPAMAPRVDIAEGLAAKAQAQQWTLSLAAAATTITGVAERVSVLAAQVLVDTDTHRADGASTPARWIEHHHGATRADAQRLTRVARALRHLDDVRIGFHDGELRLAHVDAIAGIVPSHFSVADQAIAWDAVADSQAELIDMAGAVPLDTFRRFCRLVRDRLDLNGPPDRAAEPSRVWLSETFNGRWALNGDLSADDGALLATWLDKRCRAIIRRTAERAAEVGEVDDPRPLSEVQADALIELVRDGAGATQPGRVGFMLHADLADLTAFFGEPVPPTAHTDANLDISDTTLWALLADADVTPVFWNGGQPLSYGRTRRCAPDILRQVLAHRDRTCRYPACDIPASRSQVHHTIHFEDGGLTEPDQTTFDCGFHHRGHHRGDWTLGYDPDRNEAFATTPDGQDIDPTPRWRRYRRERLPDDLDYDVWLVELTSHLATRGAH